MNGYLSSKRSVTLEITSGLFHSLKTKAAILVQSNEPLKVTELIIPSLEKGQVLVDMEWSGICRSQLMEVQGHRGADPYLPHLLGHEGTGRVIEIGNGVSKLSTGDRVVVSWLRGKGLMAKGSVFKDGNLQINSGPIATFSEKAIISENCCFPIQEDIPSELASLLGCAIPTGAGIVINEMKPTPNSSISIWGVGGIGLAAVAGAVITQCHPIVAIDISPENLRLAKSFGATHTFLANEINQDVINSLTKNEGFDFAVEATGHVGSIEKAFYSVRDRGGLCIFASHPPKHDLISLEPHALIRGKQIRGSWGGACEPDKDIPKFINLFHQGKLPLQKLISHRFKIEQINEAFEVLDSGKCGRILLDLSNN